MKKMADVMKTVTEKNLKKEANSMCFFWFNQPKEPKGIEKFKNVKQFSFYQEAVALSESISISDMF